MLNIDADTTAEHVEQRVTLQRIVFRNEEDGYIIATARAEGKRSRLSIKGRMSDPVIGQEYVVTGTLRKNSQYGGYDLTMETYRSVLPDEAGGIYRYLTSGVKWLGPTLAREVIKHYGDDTLNALKERPDEVAGKVAGLSPERAAEISETLRKNEKLEAATIEVHQILGGVLGPRTTTKAIDRWGSDAPHVVKRNPYRLRELPGVGFKSADAVATKMGVDPMSLLRHTHAAIAALEEISSGEGSTLCDHTSAMQRTQQLLGVPPHNRLPAIMSRHKEFFAESSRVALTANWDAENAIWRRLESLHARDVRPLEIDTSGLTDDQLEAASMASRSKLMLLVGAPGTGKTYTVARIVRALRQLGGDVVLCAPTGKAAKQMTLALAEQGVDATDAKTIHSVLRARVNDRGEFVFSPEMLPERTVAVVVDEASMVDVRLGARLLSVIPPSCRLLVVGDHYQLPSVGPGAVLRDLLAAGVPSVELTEIKRNAGTIVRACHQIKDGDMPRPCEQYFLDRGENWIHLECDSGEGIGDVVVETVSQLAARYDADPLWDVQVVSPFNTAGPLACEPLNNRLRSLVNPNGEPIGKLPLYMGDKVVRLRNATVVANSRAGGDVNIVNGDIGIVTDADQKEICVTFKWPERKVRLVRGDHQLRPAYCMTCHKLQGSESPFVVVPLHRSFGGSPIWSREWVYTAFSRAKRGLVTIGDIGVIRSALRNRAVSVRRTSLEGQKWSQ